MEEQKRKSIIEELDKNVFVEAGAGAGKTTLIVSRIINQLKSGIEPKEIAVITFTNAAAEELRGRITTKVRLALGDKDLSEEERHNLEEAVKYLDLMNISTIHSFCYKLLQERMFDARLSMDVVLIEEEETILQHKRFFTNWISELKKSQWDELLSFEEERWAIANQLENVFNDICELPDDINMVYNRAATSGDLVALKARAKLLAEDFEKVLCKAVSEATGQGINCYTNKMDGFVTSKGKKIKEAAMVNKPVYEEVLKEIIATNKNKTGEFLKIKKADQAAGVQVSDLDGRCSDWVVNNKAAIEQIFIEKDELKYSCYVTYGIKAREEYRKNRPTTTISNDDLLQKTHRLICESEAARKYFADKYKCIYVDEFQDTDNIQEEFIWKLALCENGDGLRDGALFLVGDPKQSIYRFRGAQPEVYFMAKEKMGKLTNGRVYSLDNNYRSNDRIVSWVNGEFEYKDICSNEGYKDMVAQKALPSNPPKNMIAGVYYYKNPSIGACEMKDDANAVACLIHKLVNKDYLICDYDKDKKPFTRKIKYSDFLVLCHRKGDMNLYLNEMNKIGIPVQLDGQIPLIGNRALLSFARLFDFLTHPYDISKKAGAVECLEQNGIYNDKALRWLVNETKDMSGVGIAGYLCRNMEFLVKQDVVIDENAIVSIQTKVNQMVEYVLKNADSGKDTLSEQFWKYCNKVLGRELSLEYDADAVRFMNAHKAKGLEGNIVILAKRKDSTDFREGGYRKGNDYYPGVTAKRGGFDKCVWTSYRTNKDIYEMAAREDRQENVRLEYVVATRAKQAFIVMDTINNVPMFATYHIVCEDSSGREINSVADIIDDGKDISYTSPACKDKESGDSRIKPKTCVNGVLQNAPVYKSCKPSEYESASKLKATALKELEGAVKEGRRPKGNVFGDAMHRSLELMINKHLQVNKGKVADVDEKIILMSVRQALNEKLDVIAEKDVALYEEYLVKMLTEFGKWAADKSIFAEGNTVYTELPFSYYKEKSKGDGEEMDIWMNGAIDLIVKDKNGRFTVYDYKSDRDMNLTEDVFIASLKEKYSGQLGQYRYAVSRLFEVPEEQVDLRIISFMGDEDIKIRVVEIGKEV